MGSVATERSGPAPQSYPVVGWLNLPILSRLVLGVLLLTAFAGLLAVLSLRQSLHQYEASAATTAGNLAQTTEQYVADMAEKIDYLLFDAAAEIERQAQAGALDPERINQFIAQRQSLLPTLEAIRVAGADGQVIFGPDPSSRVPRNLSDRDYFVEQRDGRASGLFISRSHVSRVTGRWSIFFSRRINRPDGSFFGIAYTVIPADNIQAFFSRIDVGKGGSIGLLDDKLAVLVRHPDPGGAARGDAALSPELDRFRANGAPAAIFRSEARDEIDVQTNALRKIGRFPLFIHIALAERDYLAPWVAERRGIATLCAVFVSATLAWAFLLYHAWQQRLEADETARRTLEDRVAEKTAHLRDYATALERSNADLEQFAYVASHDLREPLRMVCSYLGLLERRYGPSLDQNAHEFIDFAKEGAVRMDRLVQDLLEFSRVGRHGSQARSTPLGPLMTDLLRVLERSIAEAGGRVIVPDALPEIVCCADELFQLLQNLISNALKFRAPDRAPEIRVGVERKGDDWLFSVADNGIGIAPEYFERIFMIFQRLHTRDRYEGTGIGLAICKKIVERHGGRIWVESEPGQGATFLFTLPIANSAPLREPGTPHDRA